MVGLRVSCSRVLGDEYLLIYEALIRDTCMARYRHRDTANFEKLSDEDKASARPKRRYDHVYQRKRRLATSIWI